MFIQCPAGGEGVRDPTGEAEEALIPPRGKQVPAAEINGHHLQAKQQSMRKQLKKRMGFNGCKDTIHVIGGISIMESGVIQIPEAYVRILQESELLGFQQSCDRKTGFLLKGLTASKPGGTFLELGTGTGASASWIIDGMDEGSTLTTVDIDSSLQSIARKYLEDDKRVSFCCEDGAAFIQNLTERFDFIFADTWPGKFELLDKTLDHLNIGGFYVIHDVFPQSKLPEEFRIKATKLLKTLQDRPDLDITELDWSTGLILAVKTAV
jgi:predicted O-methyltransferase YrrM